MTPTVVCIANGPSLNREDCDYIKQSGAFVIGVNDAYRICDLDVLYAADNKWWEHHWLKVKRLDSVLMKPQPENPFKHVITIPSKNGVDMTDTKHLNHGNFGGFQAIHLAVLLGAQKIVLVGYDCGVGPAGERHWFGDHPDGMQYGQPFQMWIQTFNQAVLPDIPIVNCSLETAITRFPRGELRDEL